MSDAHQDAMDELRTLYVTARDYVRAYAAIAAKNVSPELVDAIVNAIGTISVPEAVEALDREVARAEAEPCQ